MPSSANEQTRLLQNGKPNDNERQHSRQNDQQRHAGSGDGDEDDVQIVNFEEEDHENPRQWPLKWKYIQVALVTTIGLILPMASSIMAPGIPDISEALGASKQQVIGAQSGFVCMLGVGPLFLAPMSETFGRRLVFMVNLTIFTLLQIPTALAPDITTFLVFRTLGGLFGSVGVANGGGTISDMFEKHERATVFGIYLLGPLLGPSLGPFIGGMMLSRLAWRSLFWFTFVTAALITIACYFLLHETNSMIVLQERKEKLEKENEGQKYKVEGQSDQSIWQKIAGNATRAMKILIFQPIVLIMSAYQALIFSTMYSLYTNYSKIWSSPPYDFPKSKVAITYLSPAVGFILCACLVVPLIDRIYNHLAKTRNDGEGKPEYRLPLANIGAVLLPISLFWFGWTIEEGKHWAIPLSSMLLFGASQVSIFNSVQNYYIDAFESMAASALAAGAFLRSLIGGIVPLFVPMLFEEVGYGWGMSVFGIMAVVLMPAPLLFFWYGGRIRERFPLKL